MINIDFNFIGTIHRAIESKSFKSIGYLLTHILNTIDTYDYHKYIMYDLYEILQCKKVHIYEFFATSKEEQFSNTNELCNMKKMLQSNNLPTWSTD